MSKKIKPNIVRKCIVKDSFQIRALLEERFKELELSGSDIIADAQKHKYQIDKAMLSRYRNSGNTYGTLSQENILWLCTRYCVNVELISAKSEPYNETVALKRVKEEF
jgi:hypothetical protein